jgi:hypothetical protein
MIPGKGVGYVVPQRINRHGTMQLTLRAEKPSGPSILKVITQDKVVFKKRLRWANPANIIKVDIEISVEAMTTTRTLEVTLDDQ